jgi:hypothetical protein
MEIGRHIRKQPFNLPTDAAAINEMVDVVNILRKLQFDEQSFNISYDGNGLKISSKSPSIVVTPLGYPYGDRWTWGIDITSNQVNIYNPRAKRYGEPVYTCADYEVILYDGIGQHIVWVWSESSGLSIQTDTQTNDPVDNPPIYRGIVCTLDCIDGQASISGNSDVLGHLLTLPLFTKDDEIT